MPPDTARSPGVERIVRLALPIDEVRTTLPDAIVHLPRADPGGPWQLERGPTPTTIRFQPRIDGSGWTILDPVGTELCAVLASVHAAAGGTRVHLRAVERTDHGEPVGRDAIALLIQGLHNLEASLSAPPGRPAQQTPPPAATTADEPTPERSAGPDRRSATAVPATAFGAVAVAVAVAAVIILRRRSRRSNPT